MINKLKSVLNWLGSKLSNKNQPGKLEAYLFKYLPKDKALNIIDIGAHKGSFIAELEKFYKLKRVVFVEPILELAAYLKSAFNKNNYFVFQNAVSEKDGESLSFQINEFAETSSLLEIDYAMKELADVNVQLNKTVTVITRTLDSIINEIHFSDIDLIKIDVQGAEHMALGGAIKTLRITKFVWIEVSFKPLYKGSSTFKDIYDIMKNNGFVLLEISPGHRSPTLELLQADALFVNANHQL